MFDYKTVDEIQAYTTKMKQGDHLATSSVDMVDGIPVNPDTKKFIERLAKEFRGATFGVSQECKQQYVLGALIYRDVWLMMPGQTYALARVGHGNYSPSGAGSSMYMVYSRVIENEKFSASNDQYHMAMSGDMERAVKNAKKYIRLYSPIDYAKRTAYDFGNEVDRGATKVRENWQNAKHKAVASDLIYPEIKHLVECGHKFLSDEFSQLVTTWMDTAKAWDIEKSRPVPAYFVNVSVLRDEQVFDIIEVADAKKDLSYSADWDSLKPQRYKSDNVPEDIMGKLSVLSLLKPGQYSQGVGKRVGETMFWVERTDD